MPIRLKDIADNSSSRRAELPRLSGHSVCNPSIISHRGELLAVYKGVNYRLRETGYRGWYGGFAVRFSDSQNYMAVLSDDLAVKQVSFLEDRHIRAKSYALNGIQDLRLFELDGKLCAAGVAITHLPTPDGKSLQKMQRILLCELSRGALIPTSLMPARQVYEKNWMPWVNEGQLHLVYAQDPYEVLKVENGKISASLNPESRPELSGQSGGSCVIPFGDRFIGVIHRKRNGPIHDDGSGRPLLSYTHGLVIYSRNFDVLAVSPDFTFEGERVEFCCGMAIIGESVIFSYGVWDEQAILLKLGLESVLHHLGLGAYCGVAAVGEGSEPS